MSSGTTETNVVVPVARVVVVAIGSTHVPGVAVPAATTDDPVGALLGLYPEREESSNVRGDSSHTFAPW